MIKLLVYRFSAMGDVVLSLPVLKGVLEANDDVEIYLLTQPGFFPVFDNIDRLHLISADLRDKHKGFWGLFRLFGKMRAEVKPDLVLDLHGVIRSYFLDAMFLVTGFRVVLFNKGTLQKKWLIRSKTMKQLPNTVDRYANAFRKAGFDLTLPDSPLLVASGLPVGFYSVFNKPLVIGIAPFAKHKQKVWGIEKIEELIGGINGLFDSTILLFGGGKTEIDTLNTLSGKFSNCIVAADHFKFADEIRIMPHLSVMLSMDSANMHLASMAGVPTVSIWGATHPALGFAPYKQPTENMIQYTGDKLTCRPCSVYGNKKCIYSDSVRCMEYIPVNVVLERIQQIVSG